MKAMKRFLSLALVCLLLCGLLPSFALAEEAAEKGSVVVGEAWGNVGDTVAIDVEIKENPGIVAMRLNLQFDEAALELVDVTMHKDDFSAELEWTLWKNCVLIDAPAGEDDQDLAFTGKVITCTFKIKEDAPLGAANVSVLVDAANKQEQRVGFDVTAGAVMVAPAAIIRFSTVGFAGKIQMRFSYIIPEELLALEGAYVCFEKNGAEIQRTLLVDGVLGDDGLTSYSVPILIPEFADDIHVTLRDADGRLLRVTNAKGLDYTSGITYSAKTYAERTQVNGATEEARRLAKALYDYGTAAQIFFAYGDYEGLTVDSEVSSLTLNDLKDYALKTSGTKPEGYLKGNIQVLFVANNTLRATFVFDGSCPLSDYTFMLDGKPVEAVANGTKECYIDVGSIAAPELSIPHTISLTKGSATYTLTVSALSYAYTSVANGDEARQNMGKALYLYAMAAEAYFGKQ